MGGANLKILAFSDVVKWKGYEELLDTVKPDLVALAGDLTSDGFACFWNDAVEPIPEFQKEMELLKKAVSAAHTEDSLYKWMSGLSILRDKYSNSKEFFKIRKEMHVDKFYKFLRYAGEKSQVLVVEGDHDADFDGDYIPEEIDAIPGCTEISGEILNIDGLRFLGMGFDETRYLRILNPIIEEHKGQVDVVITHCEQKRTPLLSLLKPKIIIRGHSGSGKHLINDIPAVFTQDMFYTVIEFKGKSIVNVLQYAHSSSGELDSADA